MNKPQIFDHQTFGRLPVVVIDGVEWFGATEAAKALSFSDPHKAIVNHVDEDDSTVHPVIDSLGRTQQKKFINESGIYNLIFGAAKQGNNTEIREKARQFKRWVTSEVLPTIRKHGGYLTPDKIEEVLLNPDVIIDLAKRLKQANEEKEKLQTENLVLKQQNNEMKPKASYYDLVLQNKSLLSVSKIAKDYGMSARALNKKLHELGVQYKQGDIWLLYAKYQDKGYTQTTTHVIDADHSKVITKWTQKGRLFIYELLKKNGILPLIERNQTETA